MDVKMAPSWKSRLEGEFSKEYFQKLVEFVRSEYRQHRIYPPGGEIFSAFDHCSFDDIRVVIIGQDPYHGQGQANGLCFSVRNGITMPPSLINIFKEITDDLGKEFPEVSTRIDHGRTFPKLSNPQRESQHGQYLVLTY